MSTLPDDFLIVRVRGDRKKEEDRSHWLEDREVKACQHTGLKFGLFQRRHHCRESGGIYIDRCCNYYVPLPDLGHYQPVRIYDNLIGLPSTELLEDVMFLSDRKTEFAATLKSLCKKGTSIKFVNGAVMEAGPVPQLSQRAKYAL